MTRMKARMAAIGALVAGGALVTAAPSSADEDDTGIAEVWTDLTDSHGNSVDEYSTLSFYDGGWTGTDQKIFGPLTELVWGWYAYLARSQIIILDWVMSLGWKDFVLGPLNSLSNVMATVMATLGLRPFMLMILAVGVALLLFQRKTGTAIAELFVGASIAALAVGMLANPMQVVAGENGAITQAEEAGMTMAAAITSGGESMETGNEEEMRNALTEQLVDSFLRTPHQIINYGQIIDGGPCEEAYDEALGDEDGRLILGACDSELQKHADHPNAVTLVNAMRLLPAMNAFSFFTGVIAILSLLCVFAAGWYGVKLAYDLIMGIAPGSSRTGLFRSAGGLLASLAFLALSIPAVVLYMKIISSVTSNAGGPVAALLRFDLITLFLLLGVILIVVMWVRMRKSGKKLAGVLARLGKQQNSPGPQQVSAATRVRQGLSDVTQIARNAQSMKSGRSAAQASQAQSAPEMIPPTTPGRSSTAPASRPNSQTPNSQTENPQGPVNNPKVVPPESQTTAPERLQKRLKKGAKTAAEIGVHLGLAAASGGSSVAATGGKAAVVAGNTSRMSKVANAARTAQARTQQVRNAVQEGKQRLGRTSKNLELRRQLGDLRTQQPSSGDEPRRSTSSPSVPAGTRVTGSGPSSQSPTKPAAREPRVRSTSSSTTTSADRLRARLRSSRTGAVDER